MTSGIQEDNKARKRYNPLRRKWDTSHSGGLEMKEIVLEIKDISKKGK